MLDIHIHLLLRHVLNMHSAYVVLIAFYVELLHKDFPTSSPASISLIGNMDTFSCHTQVHVKPCAFEEKNMYFKTC